MKSVRHKKTPTLAGEGALGNVNLSRKNVMTNHTTRITPNNVPVITHGGRPVVTTALLARLYGAEATNLINNYKRNESRFVSGKHYHKVEGAELRLLKDSISKRDAVDESEPLIASKAKSVILWTERGAARHAKMLDTEQAWEVFEKLEDTYFGKSSVLTIQHKPETLSPAHQRHILNRVAELAGMDRKKYPAVWRSIKDHFQVGSYKDIPDSQYPAVCEFMMCRPLEGDLPTATVIESPESRLNIHYPVEFLSNRRDGMLKMRNSDQAWLDVEIEDLRYGHASPCDLILHELSAAGYDVAAARWELNTYRNKMREIVSFARGLNRVIEDPQRYAIDLSDANR